MSGTPTLAEVLMQAVDSRLLDVHTALPGKVVTFYKATQTADIELQIKRMIEDADGELQPEDLPILQNVPIGFPRSTKFFVSFPLDAGDFVWVMFSEASIDQWRSKGKATQPGDARRHTLTGAMAIPCCYPKSEDLDDVHASALVVGQDGGQKVFVHDGGNVEVTDTASGAADDYVAMAGKVTSEISAMLQEGVLAGGVGAANFTAAKTQWELPGTDIESSNLKADD